MNDADANEDAARRIQEQIWMAEAAEGAADDDDAEGDNNNNNNNNNGAVQDFVRQLLDRNDNDGNNGGEDNNNANNDNDNAAAADEDEDDDDDDDADAVENRRGAIDGGIAGEVRDENSIKITRSLKCPIVLYFECSEDLDELFSPNNPMLKKGTRVCIGLDKNTKLSVVFNQYCKFVNSKIPKNSRGANLANIVKMPDFEFLHCTLLDANQTVEGSAMMKNDRIKVFRERSKDRASKMEVLRLQRESDRKYFKDLRQLLPNPSPEHMGCDVVLDCRGKVMDERGYSQHVLATTVRANSVQISKRCKWLGRSISDAREDIRRRAEMTIPSYEDKSDDFNEDDAAASEGVKSGQSEDEDDIIMAEPGARAGDNSNDIAAGGDGSAAKVEDDEDDEPVVKVVVAKAAGRSLTRKSELASSSNSVWVTLDHSPQAVKLLLEHCYTNRVQSLGQEAFVKSSIYPNAKDVGTLAARQGGPVPPFRKHEWPEGGQPTVSLHLALAGITLAEEAHMPRLSLMCEIAASLLVDNKNVIDVLSACQMQQQKTGNRLPILRKAAMLDCIMANGSSGIDHLYANQNFKTSLNERCGLVIPSILDGTVEVMPTNMDTKEIRKKKDKMALERKKWCELADNTDKNKRIMERIKWKDQSVVARRMEIAFGPDERASKLPSKKIWRDSYQRDPPPSLTNQGGRGTKRKGASSRSALAGAGTETTRSVRRNLRATRCKKMG
eukprot:CAMPEP_0172302962 /NCGR_PEP_ID=MMETSP1058-20130122/4590_1 /TAXON_ID=83371 /ORGANISM="Detonula confervacea, Strain CCMP 353" /LENGTH=724 /DNA_ID=CAMNT_0013013633 /DNA_START=26 /DNA_END=2200 /DNA_ORIENTATION=+